MLALVARDYPSLLQSAQALPARGGRQIRLGGKLELGDAALALQRGEDLQVNFVEFQHGAAKLHGIIRVRSDIVSGQFHDALQF